MEQQITVLVVIDPSQQSHPALDRAMLLARRAEGDIQARMVFVVTPFQQQSSGTVLCTSEWLKENIHQPLSGTPIDYSVILGWGSSSDEIIIQAATDVGAALTIAPYYGQAKGHLLSDDKWKLLRKSRNPVLMASRAPTDHSGRMLCTLKTQDPDYQERNERVVSTAKRFAEVFGLQVHAVNAYDDSMEFPDRTRIANQSGIANENIHVKLGEPQDVICETANAMNADLILIASQQRSGFKGALRGNMIEKILERVDRDILMI